MPNKTEISVRRAIGLPASVRLLVCKIVRRHLVDLLRVIQAPDPLSDDTGAEQNQIQES